MAINISFGDYDTVCYSNQHNIIELIRHSVGLSIEVNINAENIQNAEQKNSELEQRITELELGFNKLASRLDAVYNFTPRFDSSVTGVIIDNLRKGILP